MGSSPNVEPEMPRSQWGLVDTCFEESQYDAGIALLDRLRSPSYHPTGPHVRQLVYMALYPESSPQLDTGNVAFGSPSKLTPLNQKQDNRPRISAIEGARRLLMSFAYANTPHSLLSALPSYDTARNTFSDEEQDSGIATAALSIKKSRACWDFLKGGFIQPKNDIFSAPRGKSKTRRKEITPYTFEGDEDEIEDPAQVISEHAWPVLDWLLTLLERDESATEITNIPRHSPHLLTQIPSSHDSPAGRWNFYEPFRVVKFCLQQEDDRRRSMGVRLFGLLVNLTSTCHVNTAKFLEHASDIFSLEEQIYETLAALPSTPATLKFKVLLFAKLLTGTSTESDDKPMPPARHHPQPRAITVGRRQHPGDVSQLPPAPISIASKHCLPPWSELTRLLTGVLTEPSGISFTSSHRMMFELSVAYSTLQGLLPAEQKDASWKADLAAAKIPGILAAAFAASPHASMYQEIVSEIITAA